MRGVGLAFALVIAACHSSPPSDPNDPHAVVTAKADAEGVVFSAHGPKSAHWVIVGALSSTADAEGNVVFAVPAADLPKSGSLTLEVRWVDPVGAPRTGTVKVPFAFTPPPPSVTFVPAPRAPDDVPFGPSAEATCGGACSGKPLFVDGGTELEVRAPFGCKVALGDKTYAFDAVPTWDDAGVPHRPPLRVTVSVSEAVLAAKLPDVLTAGLGLEATLTCPSAPTVRTNLTFGRAAVVTALRARYHVMPFDSGLAASGSRKNAIIVHGSQFLDQADVGTELVRFYGAPTTADGVDLVGKILEEPHRKNDVCDVGGVHFEVERRDFGIQIAFATGKPVAKTTLSPGPPDCATLSAGPKFPNDDGKDVRVVRPSEAAIEAFVKSVLRN